jgi:hypothetical protein
MQQAVMERLVTHTVTIESQHRENAAGTTPSEYTVNFPPLQDVYGMRVTAVCMANAQYAVHAHNNVLDFYDAAAAAAFTAVLGPGNYTGAELATEVDVQMNAAMSVGAGVNFTCTYSAISNRLTITRVGATLFQLRFATGTYARFTACRVLGWPAVDTVAAAVAVSPYGVQLQGDEYLYVCVKGVPGMWTSGRCTDAVAQVIFPTGARTADLRSLVAPTVLFGELQPVLRAFTVRCVRPDGRLYDFNGQEHTITAEVYCLQPSGAGDMHMQTR